MIKIMRVLLIALMVGVFSNFNSVGAITLIEPEAGEENFGGEQYPPIGFELYGLDPGEYDVDIGWRKDPQDDWTYWCTISDYWDGETTIWQEMDCDWCHENAPQGEWENIQVILYEPISEEYDVNGGIDTDSWIGCTKK